MPIKSIEYKVLYWCDALREVDRMIRTQMKFTAPAGGIAWLVFSPSIMQFKNKQANTGSAAPPGILLYARLQWR